MQTATATPTFHRGVFEDGLGIRHHADAGSGEPLEVFELREECSTEAFEAALRERVSDLAGFHSSWFSRIRTVQRVKQNVSKLFVVSDRIIGARLSHVLAVARASDRPIDAEVTLCVIRQLVAAIALLHEKRLTIAHGAIAAERVVITPQARLIVVEHVLATALQQMRCSPEWYWRELRVALPPRAPVFDQRADTMQIGILALELMLGRPIERDAFPARLPQLMDEAWESTAGRMPDDLRRWLLQTLQLDDEQAFASAVDAWLELERVLGSSDSGASFGALETLMADHARAAAEGPTPAAPPAPPRNPAATRIIRTAAAAAPSPAPSATDAPVAPTQPPAAVVETSDPAAAPPPATLRQSPAPFSTDPLPPPMPTPFERVAPIASPMEESDMKPTSSRRGRWIAAAVVLVLFVSGGAMWGRQYFAPSAAAEAPGTLVVTTIPAGVEVFVDGQRRGLTPLTVELAPGVHELKLATPGEPRIIPFTVTAGSTVAQTLELARTMPATGQLLIRSEPPGARVTVDDVPSGTTPITIDGLTPGVHRVALATDLASVVEEVTIEAGATASLVVPMAAPQGIPVSGWIAVEAPAEVQVYEDGRLLGSSRSDRIMVSAGRHEVELVNAARGYRATRVITVAPGRVSAVRLDWPKGSLALNAQPWADVWVNGEKIGETPIGNVPMPIGVHEIVFRHPDFGEQVVRATVTASTPTRVSVDMRKR